MAQQAEPQGPTVHFGPFRWHGKSGELSSVSRDASLSEAVGEAPLRLAPQPAKLLSHLIERRGELVSRDEIQNLLWPNVEVEFEESVHTCIRKIRVALRDSATSPRYIETIPKRGYRFIGTVTARPDPASGRTRESSSPVEGSIGPSSTAGSPDNASNADNLGNAGRPRRPGKALNHKLPRRRTRKLLPSFLVALVLVALVGWLIRPNDPGRATSTLRIAVMPFEPQSTNSPLSTDNDLAEAIVESLVNEYLPSADIIGPTTTAHFATDLQTVKAMVEQLQLDYVVNARETSSEGEPRLLIEVIRGCDGAHVWVHYLDDLPAGTQAPGWIARGTSQATASRNDCENDSPE